MARVDVLRVAEDLLKKRREVFSQIKTGQNLGNFLLNANLSIILFAAIYGATMGVFPSEKVHIFYDVIKVPLLLLVTLYVSLPTYYVLDSFSGSEVSFKQMAAVLLSSFAIMSTVLLAFVPVSLFFILTTPDPTNFQTYAFIVLLNVGIFTVAGLAGIAYQAAGMEIVHSNRRWVDGFLIGLLVQVFVGTQLACVLRPYFDGGVFLRPLSGNFYISLFRLLARFLGR